MSVLKTDNVDNMFYALNDSDDQEMDDVELKGFCIE